MRRLIFWRVSFFLALVVIMILALLPMEGSEGFSGQDKLLHLLTFSALFILGARTFIEQDHLAGKGIARLYLGLFCYGIAMEWLQGLTTYRSMEVWDLLADLLGLMLGNVLLMVFPKQFLLDD